MAAFPRNATVAINPLQYFATPEGYLDWDQAPPWPELMAELKSAGFDAVHTRFPAGFAPRDYGQIIRDAGLTPAPGTIQFDIPEDGVSIEETVEHFRRNAVGYAELGMDHIFILPAVREDALRLITPAVGAHADNARLDSVVRVLEAACRASVDEGVLPILHQHVGAWVETAEETRYVMDRVDPEILGFGPDNGHMSWAGVDPIELITEYRDRVRGVHLKDFRQNVIDESRARGRTYQETVLAGLWTEPGQGDFNFDRLWDALGADFAGTIVIEVDRGTIEPPFESVRACAEWANNLRAA
nr:TIM barrel protein [Actinomycetales bacterium]